MHKLLRVIVALLSVMFLVSAMELSRAEDADSAPHSDASTQSSFIPMGKPSEQTTLINSKEEILFEDVSPIETGASLLFGLVRPDSIGAASADGRNFSGVYGRSSIMADFAYEIHLMNLLGPLSLRLGLSLMLDGGKGYRQDTTPQNAGTSYGDTSGTTDLSKYYFLAFPMGPGVNYMFYISRHQFVYPYAHIDLDYIPFMEIRSDGKNFHRGGNFHFQAAAGIRFLIDWAEPRPAWRLDNDFGVNNTYIQVEYRRLINMTGNLMDFSSNLFLFGVSFDV